MKSIHGIYNRGNYWSIVSFILMSVRLSINRNEQLINSISYEIDWRYIIRNSVSNGIIGILADSFELLPKENRPSRGQLLPIVGIVTQQEAFYNQNFKVIRELAMFYSRNEIKTFLMKGYGLSLNYPVPNHRPAGDIDLFLSDGKRADELIKSLGIEVKQNEEKHSTFHFHGIHVENHATVICELEHKSLSGVEQFLENELKEHSVFDDVSGCYLPSAMFNAVYLPLHLGGHFVFGGANLRQILDYGLMVKNSSCGSIDWDRVRALALEGGYFRFLCCLNGICVEYLGISSELFPNWKRDRALEKRVLCDIISANNIVPTSVFRKIKRFFDNRWKYNLVYGNENHVIGFFKRIRSWLIWKWGIGRKSVWDK